jgi:hypothetical protein
MSEAQLRKALRRVGHRRLKLRGDQEKLRRDTERLMRQAKGKIPISQACTLAGISRSTVYDDFRIK